MSYEELAEHHAKLANLAKLDFEMVKRERVKVIEKIEKAKW